MDEKEKEEAERKAAEEAEAEKKKAADENLGVRKTAREKRMNDALTELKKEREALEKANAERKELNAAEKEIVTRKEELAALGGGSPAGTESKPNITEEEKTARNRVKALGKATGAKWADDMDKEDGN